MAGKGVSCQLICVNEKTAAVHLNNTIKIFL